MIIGKTRTNQPAEGEPSGLVKEVEDYADANGLKVFENIVDKDGHKRFIDIEGVDSEVSGVTITYAKASLSGSHLLMVVAGSIANGTELTGNPNLVTFSLPEWIHNKIIAIFGSTVDIKNDALRDSGGGAQSCVIRLLKQTSFIAVSILNLTLNADRTFRFSFDLLIDNE